MPLLDGKKVYLHIRTSGSSQDQGVKLAAKKALKKLKGQAATALDDADYVVFHQEQSTAGGGSAPSVLQNAKALGVEVVALRWLLDSVDKTKVLDTAPYRVTLSPSGVVAVAAPSGTGPASTKAPTGDGTVGAAEGGKKKAAPSSAASKPYLLDSDTDEEDTKKKKNKNQKAVASSASTAKKKAGGATKAQKEQESRTKSEEKKKGGRPPKNSSAKQDVQKAVDEEPADEGGYLTPLLPAAPVRSLSPAGRVMGVPISQQMGCTPLIPDWTGGDSSPLSAGRKRGRETSTPRRKTGDGTGETGDNTAAASGSTGGGVLARTGNGCGGPGGALGGETPLADILAQGKEHREKGRASDPNRFVDPFAEDSSSDSSSSGTGDDDSDTSSSRSSSNSDGVAAKGKGGRKAPPPKKKRPAAQVASTAGTKKKAKKEEAPATKSGKRQAAAKEKKGQRKAKSHETPKADPSGEEQQHQKGEREGLPFSSDDDEETLQRNCRPGGKYSDFDPRLGIHRLIALCGANDEDSKETLKEVLSLMKAPYTEQVFGRCPKPTCLVAAGNELAPKVLYAIAAGIPVVNPSWVFESFERFSTVSNFCSARNVVGSSRKSSGSTGKPKAQKKSDEAAAQKHRQMKEAAKDKKTLLSMWPMKPIDSNHYHQYYHPPPAVPPPVPPSPATGSNKAQNRSDSRSVSGGAGADAKGKGKGGGVTKLHKGMHEGSLVIDPYLERKEDYIPRPNGHILRGRTFFFVGQSSTMSNAIFSELLTLLGGEVVRNVMLLPFGHPTQGCVVVMESLTVQDSSSSASGMKAQGAPLKKGKSAARVRSGGSGNDAKYKEELYMLARDLHCREGFPIVSSQWIIETVHALRSQPYGAFSGQYVQLFGLSTVSCGPQSDVKQSPVVVGAGEKDAAGSSHNGGEGVDETAVAARGSSTTSPAAVPPPPQGPSEGGGSTPTGRSTLSKQAKASGGKPLLGCYLDNSSDDSEEEGYDVVPLGASAVKRHPGPSACAKAAGNQWNTQQMCLSSDDDGGESNVQDAGRRGKAKAATATAGTGISAGRRRGRGSQAVQPSSSAGADSDSESDSEKEVRGRGRGRPLKKKAPKRQRTEQELDEQRQSDCLI